MELIIAYIGTAVVFFGLDFVWLSKSSSFYKREIGPLLLPKPNFAAAGIFYLFYIAGIVYFAVVPAINGGGWSKALIAGALLGGFAYGTYDMTNLSTLKGWSWRLCVADILWGTFLTGLAATGGFWLVQAIA
ncbi:DUF2177 family protein [Agrobacterium rosae]|uniref:DUF2177 family protein n=1 Tax=Agrobacterium rosae TaxID=1972867 RepID=A0AAE5S1T8_9HYPH|nr:DUF2177 family protein [Agrobacterium rosae]KAA3510886.1 DUF2177 family protein [Agrobacterium rosae]KAA3517923.1 DUF2177 family protein [Agrobacterium rosae]MCM2434193.1 DUF2177 family protein [Agrobacterium rosae]MDX8329540.1 DUF2177 family protein [Agrobacterium rosae]MQB49476.1 DUF2177 family protein [Agrobacterium rosae]